MTQPVQEPSQGRINQGVAFKQRQLFRRPPPQEAATEQGWSSTVHLSVLGRHNYANNNQSSGLITYAIDNLYPHNGYTGQTSNNNWMQWLCQFGPQGSLWLPIAQLATGPDYGKVTIQIASAPYIIDAEGLGYTTGGIEISANCTFVDMQTFDCYDAALAEYPYLTGQFRPFQINGADGAVGTAITVPDYNYQWDGGSGAHYIRMKTDGKHASSTGYKKRISELVFQRVSNEGYFN